MGRPIMSEWPDAARLRSAAVCLLMTAVSALIAPGLTAAADQPVLVPAEYVDHFRGMLKEGFAGAPGSLEAAEQHFLAAQRLRPDDARLKYAYGLVMQKNLRHTDAVAHFAAAAKGDPPYLPAVRATLRETIRRKKYADALEQLVDLSESLDKTPGATADDRHETARWMGRVIGFLCAPHASDKTRKQTQQADAAIRQRLAQQTLDHYDLGQQDVRVIEGELQLEQQSAEQSARLDHQVAEKEADARRDAYRARQEELLDTREKWNDWFADTSRELDTQLDQLGDRFDTLNRSVTSLIESIQAAQLDLKRLQTLADLRARQRPGSGRPVVGLPPPGSLEAELLARSQELNLYVNELTAAMKQRELTARQAQQLLAQRAAAERKYRDATGTVAQQVSRVKKWDERLKTAMDQEKNSPLSSRKLRSLANRSQSFSTYDSFDLDAERQRMLQVYDPPAP